MLTLLTSPALEGVRHGFLGRTGGASSGPYSSLNVGLGSGDDPRVVEANRSRARDAVAPGARLVTVRQVHSAICMVAGDWDDETRPEADALVTNDPGVAIAILTADCVPILFWDQDARIAGAAHAGWKGALSGVIEATVDAMVGLGADRSAIMAAIGPAIRQESYEVGPEFQHRFLEADGQSAGFFRDGPAGRAHFDLPGYVAQRIHRSGVVRVHDIGADTCADESRFFSYRRTTLAREPDYGRQISLIAP